MIDEAIILAGGFGTRLRNELPGIPKSMAPVMGKPFLEYLLTFLDNAGIRKVILSVGYLNGVIIGYFGDRFRTLAIEYVIEEEPLGTGGAIKLSLGRACSQDVFVINGDTMFDVDLSDLFLFHQQNNAEVTMALRRLENASRYGTVMLAQDMRIMGFSEKNMEKGVSLVNGGIYIIQNQCLHKFNLPDKFSIEKDFFEKFYHQVRIFGYISENYFLDIGIPEDYKKAQNEFSRFENR